MRLLYWDRKVSLKGPAHLRSKWPVMWNESDTPDLKVQLPESDRAHYCHSKQHNDWWATGNDELIFVLYISSLSGHWELLMPKDTFSKSTFILKSTLSAPHPRPAQVRLCTLNFPYSTAVWVSMNSDWIFLHFICFIHLMELQYHPVQLFLFFISYFIFVLDPFIQNSTTGANLVDCVCLWVVMRP